MNRNHQEVTHRNKLLQLKIIALELVKTVAAPSLMQFEFNKQQTLYSMEIIVNIASQGYNEP